MARDCGIQLDDHVLAPALQVRQWHGERSLALPSRGAADSQNDQKNEANPASMPHLISDLLG
jgi:hypothetical protein